jgi:hypothetical protein
MDKLKLNEICKGLEQHCVEKNYTAGEFLHGLMNFFLYQCITNDVSPRELHRILDHMGAHYDNTYLYKKRDIEKVLIDE